MAKKKSEESAPKFSRVRVQFRRDKLHRNDVFEDSPAGMRLLRDAVSAASNPDVEFKREEENPDSLDSDQISRILLQFQNGGGRADAYNLARLKEGQEAEFYSLWKGMAEERRSDRKYERDWKNWEKQTKENPGTVIPYPVDESLKEDDPDEADVPLPELSLGMLSKLPQGWEAKSFSDSEMRIYSQNDGPVILFFTLRTYRQPPDLFKLKVYESADAPYQDTKLEIDVQPLAPALVALDELLWAVSGQSKDIDG